MKIVLYSDLHLEFDYFPIDQGIKADVLVLAGDIAPVATHKRSLYDFIQNALKEYKDVVYVPGNHEYYEGDFQEVNDIITGWGESHDGLHTLIAGESVIIDGITFIGGTMWSDLSNPMEALSVESRMNDFHIIYNGVGYGGHKKSRWTARDATMVYTQTKNKIFDHLMAQTSDELEKTVVVTHHTPSFQSVHTRFAGDPCNPGYCSNLDNHVALVPPKYWLHGHVHNTMNYMIETCNVRANPKGYYGENNRFDSKYILEI